MTNLIQPTWDAAQTNDLIMDAFRAMAAMERDALGFLIGDSGKIWDVPPPKLSGAWPEVVRWVVSVTPRTYGWSRLQGNPGMVVYHDTLITIFVACGPRTPDQGDLQSRYQWVPLAWHKAYGENRRLGGAVQRAFLTGSIRWATGQQYGGSREWYTGWLIPVQIALRYTIGAS